ncbi:hypothetical protein NGM37_49840, partial [Streptomyces sp. TRM76130]|nr:hypothetical protein [Streptomyces sp. TRM76130]
MSVEGVASSVGAVVVSVSSAVAVEADEADVPPELRGSHCRAESHGPPGSRSSSAARNPDRGLRGARSPVYASIPPATA